ncbi:MAG: relaxase/mobilization nuclease domain-containing protein [Methylococcaceae bacterium]
MSRKQATFGQLVDYFEDGRQDEKHTIYHNVIANNTENIKAEFNKNATFLNKRKNGVYLYHEVLSFTKSTKLTEEKQKDILNEIAKKYIQGRAKDNLVYGVMHHDKKDNLHYHFMISSNELEGNTKHRLSKEEFSQFKKDLESYVLEVYPELEQKKLINKEPGAEKEIGEKLSNKGAELKRRTGKTSQKDSVKERLRAVFSASKNKAYFFNGLEKENLSIYVNGNTIGILDKATERKHRLKTLGMLDEFNAISQIIEEAETQKEEVKAKPKDYKPHEFRKERIDTRIYRDQQKNIDEKQEDEKEQPKETKAETKPKTDTRKQYEQVKKPYHRDEEKVKPDPSREARREREAKPVKEDYQDKTNRHSSRDSVRSENKDGYRKTNQKTNTDTKTKPHNDRLNTSQEKRHKGYKKPKTDRYQAPKRDKTYSPKNETDLNQAKAEHKPRQEKPTEQRKTKSHYPKQNQSRGHDKTDFRREEPKTEMELEIERRKAQLRKERDRDQEPDYSKDYSKGK